LYFVNQSKENWEVDEDLAKVDFDYEQQQHVTSEKVVSAEMILVPALSSVVDKAPEAILEESSPIVNVFGEVDLEDGEVLEQNDPAVAEIDQG